MMRDFRKEGDGHRVRLVARFDEDKADDAIDERAIEVGTGQRVDFAAARIRQATLAAPAMGFNMFRFAAPKCRSRPRKSQKSRRHSQKPAVFLVNYERIVLTNICQHCLMTPVAIVSSDSEIFS